MLIFVTKIEQVARNMIFILWALVVAFLTTIVHSVSINFSPCASVQSVSGIAVNTKQKFVPLWNLVLLGDSWIINSIRVLCLVSESVNAVEITQGSKFLVKVGGLRFDIRRWRGPASPTTALWGEEWIRLCLDRVCLWQRSNRALQHEYSQDVHSMA